MSDRKDEKLNNGDLREIKSLIGDADSGGFSLDDILAEFGGNPSARTGRYPRGRAGDGQPAGGGRRRSVRRYPRGRERAGGRTGRV